MPWRVFCDIPFPVMSNQPTAQTAQTESLFCDQVCRALQDEIQPSTKRIEFILQTYYNLVFSSKLSLESFAKVKAIVFNSVTAWDFT